MYTTYSDSASLVFKEIYKNSDKHVTLLLCDLAIFYAAKSP
jgi:hypothetical protein